MIVRLDDGVVSLLHANLKGERKMKKRIFSLLLVIAMLVTVLPVNAFAACSHSSVYSWNQAYDGTNRHYGTCYSCWETVYGDCDTNGWTSDYSGHYQACSVCGRKASSTATPHSWAYEVGSYGAGYHKQYCSVCGYIYSNNSSCSYYGQPYITENGQHWQECSVCGKAGKKTTCSSWSGATPNADGVSHSITCSTCKEGSSVPCTFGDYTYDYSTGSKGHYKRCTICGNKTALSVHANKVYDPYYDGKHYIKCADCGYALGTGDCQYGDYTQTATQHSRTCALCGDTVTNNHYFKNGVCECGAEKHDHKWEVSASGNTITVKCTGATGTCEYNKDGGKLIISASDAAYDGTAKAATITNTIETGSYYDDQYYVTYHKKLANDKYDSWGSSTAPTNVGEYKAVVYSYLDDDQKASVTFKITTGTLTATAEGYTGAYDGKAHGITVNAPESAEVTYSLTQDGSYSWMAPTFTEVGEYTVYYKVTEDSGNYNPTTVSGSATVKITQLDLADVLTVTAEDTEFDFNRSEWTDGVPHSIKLNVEEYYVPGTYDSITIEYSKDDGATWSSSNPTFRDAGTYPVKYRIYVDGNYPEQMDANYIAIEGSNTVTINSVDLPIDGVAGYVGPFDGNWHYSLGYRVDGEYGFNYIYYYGAPWSSWYGDDFTFTFSWTDENGVAKETSFNTANNTWQDAENWPHYKKQNVSDYDEAGHIVSVTITDNDGNYNTWSGSYSVKIGPAVGPTCSDVEAVYDAKPHHLTLMFGVDMDAYDCIEYQEQDENGQWTGVWTQREPDGISDVPSPYEPAYIDVGEYPVKWRVKIDSDMDGMIGGYNANGEKEAGGAYNSLGSLEIIAPRSEYNTITITAAELTVTANDHTITYGDAPANNGVTITGFKGSDTEATVLDQTGLTYTYDYNQFDDVGDYTITPAGIKLAEGNENYTITFVPGKLTVEQKMLGIEWGEVELPYTGEAQAPTATATGTVNGDVITLTVEGAATEVGEYTATVTGMTGEKAGNYKLPESGLSVTFKILKSAAKAPVVSAKDETIRGKNDGGIIGLTTEMEYSADGGNTWTKVTDPAVELAPGTYQVRYAETDASLPSEAAEVTINPGKYLTVTLPNGEGYTTSSDEADTADKQVYNDTFNFTVDIKEGYSKGENFKVTANGEELTPNEDGSYTISGIVEDVEVKVEGVVDNTAPTGTITVSTHKWKEFVKNITFNIFFKNSQTVTITAEDTGSGIMSIEYIACEAVLTEEYVKAIVASEWKPYTAPFAIDPDAKVVVYAKITDKAGNVKFISSDGMVFDGTAPVFNGVQDGGEYNEETKFTVTDDNLDKVTVDGVEVQPDENGNYTLPMDNKEHVLVATDKAGNETKITVNMKEKTAAPVVKPPVPSTGDEGLFLPLMLFMLSGIACVSLIVFKKKFRF